MHKRAMLLIETRLDSSVDTQRGLLGVRKRSLFLNQSIDFLFSDLMRMQLMCQVCKKSKKDIIE